MMVGNGLAASPRGKMHDGNGLRDQWAVEMVSRTYKCVMVIVCRIHPEEKKKHDG
jgi:hypothetical protein